MWEEVSSLTCIVDGAGCFVAGSAVFRSVILSRPSSYTPIFLGLSFERFCGCFDQLFVLTVLNFFLLTLQKDVAPNHAKDTVKQIASNRRPGPAA